MRHSIISKKRSWFQSPIIAIVLVLFVVWGAIAAVRAYAKQREALRMRNESKQELAQVEQKEKDLSVKIDNLSSDRGLEAEVRSRYRVVKPGEQLVIVVDNKDDAVDDSERGIFWKKLRQFIGI